MVVRIHPSLLAADFANIATELERVANADAIHIDVMDYHFVPNLSMGPVVVSRVQEISPIPLDVHLMIENPERWAPYYAEIGAETVTFHYEVCEQPIALINELHRLGARAGIAINPATPVAVLTDLLPHVDLVLVMNVEPGFGGQAFMPETLDKVREVAALRQEHNYSYWIEVDGGISLENIEACTEAGANTFVAGSSVYGSENPTIMVEELRQLALAVQANNS